MSRRRPTYGDIVRLARHSDWQPADIRNALTTEVYADRRAWLHFARYLLLGAGAAFLLSGLVFFFAYNWEALPRLAKLGIAGGLLTLTGLTALFAPVRQRIREVLLTATVVLIGVLLAVLGQVYQTGANSYQLFLAWTLFAIPWVLLVPYSPLWLLFVALLNVTLITYTQQTGASWSYLATGHLLFGLNVLIWLALWRLRDRLPLAEWLTKLVALWATTVVTVNIMSGSFEASMSQFVLALALGASVGAGWTWLAVHQRSVYYLALVGGAAVLSVTFIFLRFVDLEVYGLLIAGLALIGLTTLLAGRLQTLTTHWRDS